MAEIESMGRVVTEATIANLKDLWAAERGLISSGEVRQVTISDALVDAPLEHLDFVVDLRSRTLVGNPAHGGEHIYELL